jgi:23S rRNA (uridine2552-2'-O)-methyltransferase
MRKVRDHYSRRAREESYPARSVYKLEEIDRKYRLLRGGMRVLDIGCAPGSWTMYILMKIGGGRVLGIDLKEPDVIEDERFSFLQADVMKLDASTMGDRFDVIASDAAPATTGDKFSDAAVSLALVVRVFEIADTLLAGGGTVVAKVFQGEDLDGFVRSVRTRFERVSLFKPKSSRKESREIYIIAQGAKGK